MSVRLPARESFHLLSLDKAPQKVYVGQQLCSWQLLNLFALIAHRTFFANELWHFIGGKLAISNERAIWRPFFSFLSAQTGFF
jgi:hypothetical protein